MTENEGSSETKIVSFGNQEWFGRDELAERLGVDPRTLNRMLEREEIARRVTPEAVFYRYVGVIVDQTSDKTEREAVVDPPAREPARTEVVGVGLDDWTLARESLARLETRLEAAQEDVRRAVEYARTLEGECDRLADLAHAADEQTAIVRSELDEERGRRNELAEQYRYVVGELEAMGALRGRYHLEHGRREEAEDRLEALRAENLAIKRQFEQLARALEEAQQRNFRAELGPLTVEVKGRG